MMLLLKAGHHSPQSQSGPHCPDSTAAITMWRPLSVLLMVATALALTAALSCLTCTEKMKAACKITEEDCDGRGLQTINCPCCTVCKNFEGQWRGGVNYRLGCLASQM